MTRRSLSLISRLPEFNTSIPQTQAMADNESMGGRERAKDLTMAGSETSFAGKSYAAHRM